jgi:MFS family permease
MVPPPAPPRGRPPGALTPQLAVPSGWRAGVVAHLEARGSYPGWVLAAALAGMFATTFPITILTVSLGAIADEFGVRETTIAWVISAPMLLSAVALPLLGKLGDLYGHRRIFLMGFASATVVAALTAFAWGPGSLIGLRILAAVVGGATQPTAMARIFGVTPAHARVRAMGWWSMTGAAAPALGLVAGGPLVDLLGWRVVFVLQAVLSLGALALATVVLRETRRTRVRFDLLGAAALALGVAGVMFALGQLRALGPGSPLVLSSLGVGVVGLAAFVRVEGRVTAPLLPLGLFAERHFTASILANALQSAAYMGAFVLAPLVLLEVFGFSITLAAALMLLRTLSLTLASPLGGTLGSRLGERGAALLGCSLMTLSLGVLALGVTEQRLLVVGAGLVLQGVGHGLSLPSLTSAISHALDPGDLGIASAANRLTGQAGAAFGITLLTLVYGGAGEGTGFASAFLTGAGLSALSLLAAIAMRRPSGRTLVARAGREDTEAPGEVRGASSEVWARRGP